MSSWSRRAGRVPRRDYVEGAGAGVLEQLLVTRPKPAGPGAGGVAIGGDDGPALPVHQLPANPDLILDRRLTLEVRRIAGVDHCAHGSGLRTGVCGILLITTLSTQGQKELLIRPTRLQGICMDVVLLRGLE